MELQTVRAKCLGAELTDDLPSVWQGRGLRLQVGLFIDATTSESDFTNVVQFDLVISRDRSEDTVLVSSSIEEEIDTLGSISAANWDAGTAQHLTFIIPGADMEVTLMDPDERLWWTVRATLVSGEVKTCGGGYITFREDGGSSNISGPIQTEPSGPLSISVTDGIASVETAEGEWLFPVSGTPGTVAAAEVFPVVINGVAVVILGGSTYSWPVSGTPGNAPAGPVFLTVVNGLLTMGLGGIGFSWAVSPA